MSVGVGVFVVEDRLQALGVGAGIFIPARFGSGEIAAMFIIVRQFGFFAAIERINRIAVFARSFIVRVTFVKRLRTTLLAGLDDRISLRIKARLATSTSAPTATTTTPATRASLATLAGHLRPLAHTLPGSTMLPDRSIDRLRVRDRTVHRHITGHISRWIQRRAHRRPALLLPGRTAPILAIKRTAVIRSAIISAAIVGAPIARIATAIIPVLLVPVARIPIAGVTAA